MRFRLSNEAWVHDGDAREAYVNDLLEVAEMLAMSGNKVARAVGLCRYAITPSLIDWLAKELRSRRTDPSPKLLLTAMNVATAPIMADFAKQTLLSSRIEQLPDLSARQLAAYLMEELAS